MTELRQEAEQRLTGYRFRVTALCSSLVVQVVRQLTRVTDLAAATQKKGRAHLVLHAREWGRTGQTIQLEMLERAWDLEFWESQDPSWELKFQVQSWDLKDLCQELPELL